MQNHGPWFSIIDRNGKIKCIIIFITAFCSYADFWFCNFAVFVFFLRWQYENGVFDQFALSNRNDGWNCSRLLGAISVCPVWRITWQKHVISTNSYNSSSSTSTSQFISSMFEVAVGMFKPYTQWYANFIYIYIFSNIVENKKLTWHLKQISIYKRIWFSANRIVQHLTLTCTSCDIFSQMSIGVWICDFRNFEINFIVNTRI